MKSVDHIYTYSNILYYEIFKLWLWVLFNLCFMKNQATFELHQRTMNANTGCPKKTEQSIQSIFRTLLSSTVTFFTLLDRASISHYNNIKIIKFGWEIFILWDISLGLVIFVICPISRVSRHDDKLMANPQKWQSIRITHKIKSFQPNFMILVLV